MIRLPALRAALVLAAAALAAAPAVPPAAAADAVLEGRVAAARELIGVDPQRARDAIAQLRSDALAGGSAAVRLAADEIECRLLSDLNIDDARRTAESGLAAERAASAAGSEGPTRLPLLRLRVCHASTLLDAEQTAAGLAELDAVINEAGVPELAAARGLALMERGVHRSRRGDLSEGQRDLLVACSLLAPQPRDAELCNAHLANHYRRIGDLDEALPLALHLLEGAQRRGAAFDESIYVMIAAQIHAARGEHPQALARYAEAARFADRVADSQGLVKAEYGTAESLLALGRAEEALRHLERALAGLHDNPDPVQNSSALLLRAEILVVLDRPREALEQLAPMDAPLRERPNPARRSKLLRVQADAYARLGRWHEAWQALSDWARVEQALQAARYSKDSARLRLQFNRERDDREMSHLRRLNDQGEHLRMLQAVALGLAGVLLALLAALAVYRRRREREAQALAATDELTGLPNRRALLAFAEAAAREAQRRQEPLALLMIDVDHFKRINDEYGHAVGDEVLRHLARVLGTALRHGDRLGRLGGEEFAAVLPGAARAQAGGIAERMRVASAAAALAVPSGVVRFTVSIGVAELAAGEPLSQALQRADAALYAAKQSGRNAVTHAPAAVAVATVSAGGAEMETQESQ